MSKKKRSFVTIRKISIKNFNLNPPSDTSYLGEEEEEGGEDERFDGDWDGMPTEIREGLASIGVTPGKSFEKATPHLAILTLNEVHAALHSVHNDHDIVAIIEHIVCQRSGSMKDLVEATAKGTKGCLQTQNALDFVCDRYKISKPVVDFGSRKPKGEENASVDEAPIV